MTEYPTITTEHRLILTEEERNQLLTLLEQVDRRKLVEIHRTDALDYRKFVEHEEAIFHELIAKLREC